MEFKKMRRISHIEISICHETGRRDNGKAKKPLFISSVTSYGNGNYAVTESVLNKLKGQYKVGCDF